MCLHISVINSSICHKLLYILILAVKIVVVSIMLSQRLIALREEAELTQAELANKLNISRSGYARYETGDRKPGIDILAIIADFYGTSVDYLMGRTYVRDPYPKHFKRPKY